MFLVAAMMLGGARPALAEEPTTIWYRSSSGCPSGAAFRARVEARGRAAKIATAGDRVDFVVTLGEEEEGAVGRLERQTGDGIVAIREVAGETCDEVAGAIAFTLGLVNQRSTEEPATPTEPAPPTPQPDQPPAPATAPRETSPSESSAAAPPLPPPPVANPPPPAQPRAPRLGLSATGRSAIAPGGAWGGTIAFDFDELRLPWRLEAVLVRGAQDTTRGSVTLSLGAGRLAVCPIAFERAVRIDWCSGVELGSLRTRGSGEDGRRAGGLWAAGSVEEHLRWPLDRPFALEGSLGFFVPFVTYSVIAEHPRARLHRVDSAGLAASVGVSGRLP